jgi:head-tail adaptor
MDGVLLMFRHRGELRWKAKLLEPKDLPRSASGFVRQEWRVWAEEWCKVEEGVGEETQGHDQRGGGLPVLISMDYCLPRLPRITDAVELQDGTGRTLNVVAVRDPDGTRRQIELACRVQA